MRAFAALFPLLSLGLGVVLPSRVASKSKASLTFQLLFITTMCRAGHCAQASCWTSCPFMHDFLYPRLSRARLANAVGEHRLQLLHSGTLRTPRSQDLNDQFLQSFRCLLRAHDQCVVAYGYCATAGPRCDAEQDHVGFPIPAREI